MKELTREQIQEQIDMLERFNPLVSNGMTLRDHFAALAMLGMHNECYDLGHAERAKYAYEQADQMLLERKK